MGWIQSRQDPTPRPLGHLSSHLVKFLQLQPSHSRRIPAQPPHTFNSTYIADHLTPPRPPRRSLLVHPRHSIINPAMPVSRAPQPAQVNGGRPQPAEITFKGMRFLITDRPSDSSIEKYIDVSGTRWRSPFYLYTCVYRMFVYIYNVCVHLRDDYLCIYAVYVCIYILIQLFTLLISSVFILLNVLSFSFCSVFYTYICWVYLLICCLLSLNNVDYMQMILNNKPYNIIIVILEK